MKKILLVLILLFHTTPCAADMDMAGLYRIYCFDHDYTKNFSLGKYVYDDAWQYFLAHADLQKAVLVITDKDITRYQWESQKVTLSEKGSRLVREYPGSLSGLSFVATLDGKRLYAGRFLSRISAMAIEFPVIHYDLPEENTWQIFPIHILGALEEIPLKLRERTMRSDIKKYFESLPKLTHEGAGTEDLL